MARRKRKVKKKGKGKMSRPIVLTQEHRDAMVAEFAAALGKAKLSDGKITYTKEFTFKTDSKAVITITPLAYHKILALIHGFETEVGWHGIAYRDNTVENGFRITDVLVYPQVVTSGTVEMDGIKYDTWLYKHDDDVFNHLRMQGHSHVNFSTSPSTTDIDSQRELLKQVEDFYIFFIWNKKGEMNNKIYDVENNILFENNDITVVVEEELFDRQNFLKEAKDLARVKMYTYYGQNQNKGGNNQGWSASNTQPAKPPSQTAQTTTVKKDELPATPGAKEKPKDRTGYGGGYSGYGYPYDGYEGYSGYSYGGYRTR